MVKSEVSITAEEEQRYFLTSEGGNIRSDYLNTLLQFYEIDLADSSTFVSLPEVDLWVMHNVLQYVKPEESPSGSFEQDIKDVFDYVNRQRRESVFSLSGEDFSQLVIAYEPIWAIGTGKTATIQQAQEMHHQIRNDLADQFGNDLAEGCTLLYGGSCNPANAKELFACPDVDGGLIGGASLKADDFVAIVNSY